MIENFAMIIRWELRNKSGYVFFTGRSTFSKPRPLYIIDLNSGTDAALQARGILAWHAQKVLAEKPAIWSEFSDVS